MMSRSILMMVMMAAVAGCTRYGYPPNNMQSAASVNADLVAAHGTPKTLGRSHVRVDDVSCAGADYAIKVHYEHDFEKVEYLNLQYQVMPKSSHTAPLFTRPSGLLELDPWSVAGDVTLTVPGKLVTEKDSDILLRLKLKSKTVFEHLSAQEQVHISELCR